MDLDGKTGRQLSSLSGNGLTASYTYDIDGLRTSKTVNGVRHEYYYVENRLQYESFGNSKLWFFYDVDGNPSGVRYNNGSSTFYYYFVCNWRGDVLKIFDSSGSLVANYDYDAWGNVVSITNANDVEITSTTHIANVNPLRYRGYYYDAETGIYYVSSRYYDPEICRFISIDTTDVLTATPNGLTDKNLYAYCDNNPVMRIDCDGDFWNYVIGGVVGAAVGGVSAALNGGNWKAIVLGTGLGTVGGLLAASGIPIGFQIVAGGLLGGGSNLASQTLIDKKSFKEVDWIDVGIDTVISVGASVISYGITKNASKVATSTINKGINKIVSGKNTLESTGRYGKGAIKKGLRIMRSGVKNLNIAQGKSSVIGSFSSGVISSVKNFIKKLFR